MDVKGQKILVTGVAGFVGFHVARQLLKNGAQVLGIDEVNDYYDVGLKNERLRLLEHPHFQFRKLDINSDEFLTAWHDFAPSYVLHFAAQAGVRYSFEAPEKYIHSNLGGFFKIVEGAKKFKPRHLIYASSSSVYGNSTEAPFSTSARADQPISIYAATKRSNELLAYTYSHLFQIPMTGLRFFTVYGSYGRPDMAYYKFAQSIRQGKPITVYNYHEQKRDFTHVSDIVESILRLVDKPTPFDTKNQSRHRVLNIGASQPTTLAEFVTTLEKVLGKKAQLIHAGAQPGDVNSTYADVSELEALIDYRPKISLEEGLREFVTWYQEYAK